MQCWAVICWALLAVAAALECPDGGRCQEGQTCCSSPAAGYGCCPLDQAECCGDHVHCCPADTVCDPSTSSCVNATASVPWVKRASADQPSLSRSFRMIQTYMGEDDGGVCPDQSRCPAEFSCLETETGFGCCPLAQGVPCPDGRHCCPGGHRCSADGHSCIREGVVSTVLCGDRTSECPDGTTCCETPEGKWGCCPLPNAVCCSDKTHCCPEGSTCDVERSKCISLATKTASPMWAKLPARTRAEWENQKDAEVPAAAADQVKPEKVPERSAAGVPLFEREVSLSSVRTGASGHDVPCDDTSACPDGTTCCKNQEGDWACCPLPKAVCCNDHEHCCPEGQTCNLAAQTCDSGLRSQPWVRKTPAVQRKVVQCDQTSACPDGSTCCKTKDGGWGCCPLPEAVCCDDHENCCPEGTTCHTQTLTCEGAYGSTPMRKKTPAFATETALGGEGPQKLGDVQCDQTTKCADGQTCCRMSSTTWGCCPIPSAVCCSDMLHCCPTGFTCTESGDCTQSAGLDWRPLLGRKSKPSVL